MTEDMVMRSVYLRPLQDGQLRQLAHALNVTKSDLIRSAISVKLAEWLKSNDREKILEEIALGRRDEAAIRRGGRGSVAMQPVVAPRKASADPTKPRKAAADTTAADSPGVARDALV